MSLRDALNKNSTTSTAVSTAIIILAVAVLLWQFWPSGYRKVYTETYFTSDDGQSYFADDLHNVPPYTKDGKEAVAARVYRCGGKTFVGFMTRFNEAARKRLEEAKADGTFSPDMYKALERQTEFKRPGDPQWAAWSDDRSEQIVNVFCPDGTRNGLTPLFP